ncbi:hypothetical protein VHEMI07975 [[Torrubiella] hemipterigena]|uniref:H/ACA ribonucleoprotein complex non-core subunit NAF1 n=1 Tax=[Torrubiella] hemipterigena TaxID=1531966 RepID=A0A0A1TMC9_9HYPO|nr:hypothetical protein VHEMI07975 [[Torrubiella] hemipterigena]
MSQQPLPPNLHHLHHKRQHPAEDTHTPKMSGFQIPGLGHAKPGEKLPPLPADILAAAASAHGTEDRPETDAAASDAAPPPLVDDDAMAIDQPSSPPSLTGALEAALGGLEAPPPNPEPAPLQPDTSENPEWEIDSSPYASSSSSVSTTSSEDEDSDAEPYELMSVEETARMLMAEAGSDDEGDSRNTKPSAASALRTKNEIVEDPVPLPDVTITDDMPLEELGSIQHIVDTIALVAAVTTGEYQVLDTGSVLCTASRTIIGTVAETIGKVLQPLYTVRFNSVDEITTFGLEVGTKIFYTPAHATFVFTEPLKAVKGSDASNLYDEEAGDDEMEFSDDEKEAEHKRAIKQKKKDKWAAKNPDKVQQPSPLRQETSGGLNYDDVDVEDGPYKPLARPSSMASGPSGESYESNPRRGGGRGAFRGKARGRGGRGGYANRDGYALPPQGQQQQQQQQPAPSMPAFGFQVPGFPGGAVPPPPPGWQPGQQANPAAILAALMGQMQAQGGQPNAGWTPPPPPPPQ